MAENNYKRIAGDKARRYQDTVTGQIISRRQYDEKIGRLAARGLTPETQAKQERETNPIQASLRPRRGKPAPGNKDIRKQVKKNRKRAVGKPDVLIGEFEVPFTLEMIVSALYELLRIGTKTIYYTTLRVVDASGNESLISNSFYKRVPTTTQSMIQFFEDVLAMEEQYKLSVIGVIFHWRLKRG